MNGPAMAGSVSSFQILKLHLAADTPKPNQKDTGVVPPFDLITSAKLWEEVEGKREGSKHTVPRRGLALQIVTMMMHGSVARWFTTDG